MNNEKQEILEQASKAYYEGKPIMSDEAFDTLSDLVKNPKVGYTVDGSRVKHLFRMYSLNKWYTCLLYTSPSPRDATLSRMPSSA